MLRGKTTLFFRDLKAWTIRYSIERDLARTVLPRIILARTLLENLAEFMRHFHTGYTFNCAMAGSNFPAKRMKTRGCSLR